MERIKKLGQLLIDEQLECSKEISTALNGKYIKLLQTSDLEDDVIVRWRANLLQLIGEAMLTLDAESVKDSVTDWAKQTSEGAVKYNVTIDELLVTIKCYRMVIWNMIRKHIDKDTIAFDVFLKINEIIDYILDHVSHIFSVAFVDFHNKSLKLVNEEILEVSTPVVALSDKVAVLPLIGELDTNRARILLESSLDKCVELRNEDLIIDLSGVPIVDTMVANELIQLANALQLVGVRPTFTGIRPEIAQTMVKLGLNFTEVRTASSLKQVLNIQGINVR